MFCAKVVLYCNNRKFIAMALSSNQKKACHKYVKKNIKKCLLFSFNWMIIIKHAGVV